MRILQLSALYPPHIVGGAERSVEQLSRELVALGHTVGAACLAKEGQPKEDIDGVTVYRMYHNNDFWLEDSASHSRAEVRWAKIKQQWNWKIEKAFGEVLDDFKPDVVNSVSMVDLSTLVWYAAKKRRVPIVHTLCDYDLLCSNSAMFRNGAPCRHRHLGCRVTKLYNNLTRNMVDAVASVGTVILQTHLDYGFFRNLPANRRRVIFYSCSVERDPSRIGVAPGRADAGLTFGYLGRINVEKGVGTLIDALKRLDTGGWRCKIAGVSLDGSAERFKAQAAGLPVEFVGWTSPDQFLREIDVLVVPSYWAEPSPRTIFEAYAMDVPVLGARSGGIPELVGDSNGDWLFTPGDDQDLALKLTGILRRGRSALPTAEQFQDVVEQSKVRRVAENYLEIYQEVVRLGGSR